MMTFVTSNRHKYDEIQHMFAQAGLDLKWMEMKYEEIQADTTEEVSRDSCRRLRDRVDGDYFIEDTGLFIDELKGFPGVYSSYVHRTIGNSGIIRLLDGSESPAQFKTVISASIDGDVRQYSGIVKGRIILQEKGKGGFGYDPIFVPDGTANTLAELDVASKNKVSHRARAVRELIRDLQID